MISKDQANLAKAVSEGNITLDVKSRVSELLKSDDELTRRWAAIAWGALADHGQAPDDAEDAARAIAALVEIARGRSEYRAYSDELEALCDVAPLYDASTYLSDPRNQALAGLYALGPRAEAAVPVLVELLASSGDADSVRGHAAEALGSMAASKHGDARATDPRILDALIRAANDKTDNEGTVREGVFYALCEIGPPARDAIPTLEAALGDGENKFLFERITETIATLSASA